MEQPPTTLNPRIALDAAGQRLGSLVFAALTKIDADLEPRPELAAGWKISTDGKSWTFEIRKGLKDHAGQEIGALQIAQCLEEYRVGKPASPLAVSFPQWKSTGSDTKKRTVTIELIKPDPYLGRNLSLFRYFRTQASEAPCREGGGRFIGSGDFIPDDWNLAPISEILLRPRDPSRRPIKIIFVRDETTRTMMLLNHQIDAVQNGLSLSKTRWIQNTKKSDFSVLERDGVSVGYLAFNLRNPILKNKLVREAIAHAIPREDYIKNKMFGFGSLSGSFLSAHLPENLQIPFSYDPILSERLLDQAGYPKNPSGVRLKLKYKTTPSREGQEQVLVFSKALSKIGISLSIEVVELAVFLASVRKGAFDLYSSRWVGVSDGSILYRTLYSTQTNNRAGYNNPVMDELLDRSNRESDLKKRSVLIGEAQKIMMQDLPYFPLWFWSNSVVIRNEHWPKIKDQKISLSGALDPLVYLLTQ